MVDLCGAKLGFQMFPGSSWKMGAPIGFWVDRLRSQSTFEASRASTSMEGKTREYRGAGQCAKASSGWSVSVDARVLVCPGA